MILCIQILNEKRPSVNIGQLPVLEKIIEIGNCFELSLTIPYKITRLII